MTEVSFVILTWNSRIFLEKCFSSIEQLCDTEQVNYEIIIIDNGSTDGSSDFFHTLQKEKSQKFHCILLRKNKGTTYSRNIGLKLARGSIICVLDSDTEFLGGSLKAIINFLEQNESIAIVAPLLLLPDGTVQHSVKKFPTFWNKIIKLPKILLKIKTHNADFYRAFPFQQATRVDMAISACWFFRKNLLDCVGYLDEKIFYSPEDLDFCMRIKKIGKTIIYNPSLRLLHHTQQITHKKPFSKSAWSHLFGLLYYYRKHGGWFLNSR